MNASTPLNLLPEVVDFLAASPLKAVVGGRDTDALDGGTFATLDPGTGEHLAHVVSMQAPDIDLAVQAAAKAWPLALAPALVRAARGRSTRADPPGGSV